ncbi:hypothetical protein [Paraburkholderia sp. MM6662-R1]|uniref:hypothetical protein n=1 Tax=Paraburkholderia sp. MM6662-R1 TaxID=2991066 RepID=UPI003D2380F4
MNQPQPSGYAVIARMLGLDVTMLRAVAAQWETDPNTPPLTLLQFAVRCADAHVVAQTLNNTNLWELAIHEAFDPKDIPHTLPTLGVPRLASDADKE